jgi:hypothetical protein
MEFDILVIFRKSVQNIQVTLKSDKINGNLHEDICTFVIAHPSVLVTMRNVTVEAAENTKTHFVFSNCIFFRKYCRF